MWNARVFYLAGDAKQQNEEKQIEGMWSYYAGILHGWVITVTRKKQ